jgi:hypothetical protein|tara:strand:+ start:9376 stop:9495 length:120 start_codon:yes stop_codon:yes gene_type:complete
MQVLLQVKEMETRRSPEHQKKQPGISHVLENENDACACD